MSNQQLIKAGCLVGGLIGLGILVYMMLKEDDEKVETALNEPGGHQEGNPNRAGNRKPTSSNKNPPGQGHQHKGFEATLTQQQADLIDASEETDEPAEQLDMPVPKVEKVNAWPLPEADAFPLRLGSQGERVERLQVWLMRNYGLFGKITEIFDEKIEGLVKKHLGVNRVDEKTYNQYKMGKHVTEQVIVR